MNSFRPLLLGVATALCMTQAHATDIYRWTDETGRVHMSDSVPERYRAGATRIDSAQYLARDAEVREAATRAERDKARADAAVERQAPRARPQGLPQTTTAPSQAAADVEAECAMAHRAFRASQECFGPFRNVNGSVKPEALAVCREVPDPTTRCGPPQ